MKKKYPILIILVCIITLISFVHALATGDKNNGYRVNHGLSNGGQLSGYGAYSGCVEIMNLEPYDIFVPTRTEAEWDAFVANHSANISVFPCGP